MDATRTTNHATTHGAPSAPARADVSDAEMEIMDRMLAEAIARAYSLPRLAVDNPDPARSPRRAALKLVRSRE